MHESMRSYQIGFSCHAVNLMLLLSSEKVLEVDSHKKWAKLPLENYLDCRYLMINMFDNSNHAEKRIMICHIHGFTLKSKAVTG